MPLLKLIKYLFLIISFSTLAGTFDALTVLNKSKSGKDYSKDFCNLTEKQREFVLKKEIKKIDCKKEEKVREKVKSFKEIKNAK